MKTIKLLSVLLLFLFCNIKITKAQCTFISPTVEITNTVQSGATCTINFNLAFDIITNGGNKIIYIHLWPFSPTNSYPSYDYNAGGHFPPTNTTTPDLLNTLVNIAINNFGANPVLLTTYGPDATVPIQSTGLTITKASSTTSGATRFTIKNVSVNLPSTLCGSAFTFKGDAWSSNSNSSSSKVQCYMTGIEVGLTNPKVFGLCTSVSNVKTYGFTVSTESTTGVQVYYDVYLDNGDGIFNPSDDNVISSLSSSSAVNITASSPLVVSGLSYPTTAATSKHLFVVTHIVGKPYDISADIAPCLSSNLAANLLNFTATKNGNNALVNWTTSSIQNCKYFEIQKSSDNNFSTIATINSKDIIGNSTNPIIYEYEDKSVNVSKTMYYRLKIVDKDDKIEYSSIKSLNFNNNDFNIAVYPNPSIDGKINIMLSGNTSNNANINITNMLGQKIYSSTNYKGNILTLNNLEKGIYNVNVYLLNSKQLQTKRFIVD